MFGILPDGWGLQSEGSRLAISLSPSSSLDYLLQSGGLIPEHSRDCLRIPAMPIANSELMAITIPKDADRRRSEATLGCSYHAEVIGIRQSLCA
jgi:hypothetical protein